MMMKEEKIRMLYSEKVKVFTAAHPCKTITVDGAQYRYILRGESAKTLVFLNGGMNTLEMWMDYVDALSGDGRVLLFDYPQELRTNQALVAGMHAFFQALGITQPIFIGASDGGMVAQIYVQKFPGETGGLILISTGGMDANTLKTLKKKYFLAPLMLWYMKHCNYEKLKPTLIKAGMCMALHIRTAVEDSCLASHLYAGRLLFDKKGGIRYNKRNKERTGKRRLTDELMARYQPGADAAGGFSGGDRN